MPELPDLQVISHNLDQLFSGKVLKKLTVERQKNVKIKADKLRAALEGKKLKKIIREGKELRLQFEKGSTLRIHLMLHGAFHQFEHENKNRHTLVSFLFDSGSGLALTDFQGLATVTLDPPDAEAPDALSKSITPGFLKQALASSRSRIKSLLTNQHVIRGIGNAYADEILWDAQISPFSVSNKIPPGKMEALAHSIHHVLADAEKQIQKEQPGIIAGEVRDFMKIHHPKKDKSPTGVPIEHQKSGSGQTYFTREQTLYQ